jgi:hypothetical protein
MSGRRVEVFFYGLFMDQELLRAKDLHPTLAELAWLDGLSLRIGQRAALAPQAGARVYGVVMSLTLPELERLYSDPSVAMYRPEAVLAHLVGGGSTAALCYNLPEPPSPGDRNPEYAAKLRVAAQRVGLPAEYIASIQ